METMAKTMKITLVLINHNYPSIARCYTEATGQAVVILGSWAWRCVRTLTHTCQPQRTISSITSHCLMSSVKNCTGKHHKGCSWWPADHHYAHTLCTCLRSKNHSVVQVQKALSTPLYIVVQTLWSSSFSSSLCAPCFICTTEALIHNFILYKQGASICLFLITQINVSFSFLTAQIWVFPTRHTNDTFILRERVQNKCVGVWLSNSRLSPF